MILAGQFDVLFTLNDLQILNPIAGFVKEAREKNLNFKWVLYSPLDGNFVSAKLAECMSVADFPVCYTQFQYDKTVAVLPEIKNKLKILYHGCEPETFYPISRAERTKLRKEFFGIEDSTFLLINVNRNQWRKDLGRTMFGFKKFHDKYPDSRLYLHSQVYDVGGSILDQARGIGLDLEKDIVVTPKEFNAAHGFTRELLNKLYGCSDVVVSTTLGEGWGLSVTEAMCAKVPVLVPKNTSLIEMIGENEERGWLAECGTTDSEWMIAYGFSDLVRPVVNVPSFVSKLEAIKGMSFEEREKKLYAAYKWAQEHTWAKVCEQWKLLFQAASKE